MTVLDMEIMTVPLIHPHKSQCMCVLKGGMSRPQQLDSCVDNILQSAWPTSEHAIN